MLPAAVAQGRPRKLWAIGANRGRGSTDGGAQAGRGLRSLARGAVASRALHLELTLGTTTLQHLTRVARAVAVPLIAAVILSGCGSVDQGPNVDPDQLDAVEAPELGACRMLVPDDVAKPSNATRTVSCIEAHTAETYAVGPLPDRFQDASYGSKELGLLRLPHLRVRVPEVPGRRRVAGHAHGTQLGVVPAVGEGVGRRRPLVPLRRGRRRGHRARSTSTCPARPRVC